jgi:Kef-type K+ transport system membrane component KefB
MALTRLLLQMVIVVLAARLGGAAARRLGQPAVVGEMLAGIAIGPSVLGALAPGAVASLFPADSLATLGLLSQLGVILFIFVVGMEFEWHHVGGRARAALLVSSASILLPFLLGTAAALALYDGHAPPGIPFRAFALFMGIAMSITAFPVLARILAERRLLQTPIGSLALTCAAINDVAAWILLALVVAVVASSGSLAGAAWTIGATALFVAVMFAAVRPLLARVLSPRPDGRPLSSDRLALVLAALFASALATEAIGVHALFGAFVAGIAMPAQAAFRSAVHDRLEGVGSVLLLPLFFAVTGLRTDLAAIGDWGSLGMCLSLVLLATAGKLGGTLVAARLTGLAWREAFVLGALMNTRGLMELVALGVGYELGVLSPAIYSALVTMAIVTTMMTGPMVDRAGGTTPRAA